MIFVGLIGMIDPARPEVPPALEIARTAGIRTVMITGDYPNTARAIAEESACCRQATRCSPAADLDQTGRRCPQDRSQTHRCLRPGLPPAQDAHRPGPAGQRRGRRHDRRWRQRCPSIKQADIGVAMGITGTDVTKETADMVLTDDNYASIVSAVEQGRVIYSNIRKFVYYLLSCNLAEIAIIFLATLAGCLPP